MEIVYKREDLKTQIEQILSTNGTRADLQLRKQSFEEYKGPPLFGSVWPPFDFGQNVLNFVVSKEMLAAVIAEPIWKTVKAGFQLLLQNKQSDQERLAIITDRAYDGNHKYIAFIFYAYQSEDEVAKAIIQIPGARTELLKLLGIVTTTDTTIRLTYLGYINKWAIENYPPRMINKYVGPIKRVGEVLLILISGWLIGHFL